MKWTWLILSLLVSSQTFSGTITVSLEGLPSKKGSVLYLLFKSKKGFPDEDKMSVKSGSLDLDNGKTEFEILDVPQGKYALSVIHDENSNDKLDTSFIGIPKEAFGFSNNPGVYFGPPSFKNSAFKINGDKSLTIKMKKM